MTAEKQESAVQEPEPEKRSFGTVVVDELKVFVFGLSMSGGDWGSLTQLFFDNLSTLLNACFAIQSLASTANYGPIAVSNDLMNEVVWGKIVPGVGTTMIIGNIFYTWQGCHACAKYKRQYTANPYGINTPATFAVIYNVIYGVFFSEGGGDAGFTKAYNVALASNFVVGLIIIFLGFFGKLILKVVPPAGLLVPIAGIGVAFLGLENVSNAVAAPLIGFNTIMWVYLGWYANVRLGYGNFRLPEALQVILIGVIMGWAIGNNTPEATVEAAKLVQWYGPSWVAKDIFSDFSAVGAYLGTVIPLGISAAATSLMCLVSAKEAGDPYPVSMSMIFDGIGTLLAACLGSPFGLCLYIGHPAHKRNGAKVGYSLVNGFIYLICTWFGILALMQSIVNPATIGPIVFFVGLQVNEEALNFMPNRQYAAYIIGIFPSIYDWVTNISNRSPLSDDTFTYDINSPNSQGWYGLLAWKCGSLLVSLLWTSILVMVLDRKWTGAAIWSFIASLFSVFGIIHSFEAGFKNFTTPQWQDCSGPDVCWEFGIQWMYFAAYLMLCGTFIILHFIAKCDPTILPPIQDESSQAFDDWFADAYKWVDEDGYIRDSRYPDGDPEGMIEQDTEKHLIGEEMSKSLRQVYGDQSNPEADKNFGNDHHFGSEGTKALKKSVPVQSESRIANDQSSKSGISNISTSVRNPENVSAWSSSTGAGRKLDDDPQASLRHKEHINSWKSATGADSQLSL